MIVPAYPPRPPMIDVPPMTAAATDGSTADSTSEMLAVLTRPATSSPASAASTADRMYSATSTCHTRTPDSRDATGLSPTANSSRPNPVYRRPSRIAAATGTNSSRLLGRKPRSSPDPSHWMESGSSTPEVTIASW